MPFRPALRRFGLEDRCRERGPQFWCPRKDLNLQPLVCRTSAPSIELLRQELAVGVGFEPTYRALQTRANPPQLSDLEFFATDERGLHGLENCFLICEDPCSSVAKKNGTPGRIRTHNYDVRSVALFQLSYRSNCEGCRCAVEIFPARGAVR